MTAASAGGMFLTACTSACRHAAPGLPGRQLFSGMSCIDMIASVPADGDSVRFSSNCASVVTMRWIAPMKAEASLDPALGLQLCQVSISADAHSAQAISHLHYGVTIARRAGLGPADVLNAKPLDELRAWLAARRKRAGAA